MGFLSKIFGASKPKRAPASCALEQYINELSPGFMSHEIRKADDAVKTAQAQAMTVLGFSGIFVNGLRVTADSMPEIMRSELPFPYERALAETAAFYYFSMIKGFVPNLHVDWDDDEDDDSQGRPAPTDPYFETLKLSMAVCGHLISALTDKRISGQFVGGRAMTLVSRGQDPKGNVIESFARFLLNAWDPESSRPYLELANPTLPIHMAIASMPLDAVSEACRELYDEKARKPKAY